MSKFVDFYNKVVADAGAKKEVAAILGGTPIESATDEQLEKIGALAKKLGFDSTLAEAREFLKSGDKKLTAGDLDAVAGGAEHKPPVIPFEKKIPTVCKEDMYP